MASSSADGRARRWRTVGGTAGLLVAASGCAGALDPKGAEADHVAGIWWLMFGLGSAIYALVLVVLLVALRRGRREGGAARLAGTPLLIGGGVVLPVAVMVLLTSVTAQPQPRHDDGEVVVEIDARQFWWRIAYRGVDGAITANELHVPVGRPVELVLTAPDVIHSFWVPELGGKLDLVPGRTNRLTIEASEAGVYQGRCAEFCGLAHAHMRFLVVAQEPAEFTAWLDELADDAVMPSTAEELSGREVFLGSCSYCHAVRGTNATSDFGPDLTHLASRRTLGAGTLDNTIGDLGGWILDPQRHKPGNEMPSLRLDPDDLQALLTYLRSLE